jgi:hypothetical protein
MAAVQKVSLASGKMLTGRCSYTGRSAGGAWTASLGLALLPAPLVLLVLSRDGLAVSEVPRRLGVPRLVAAAAGSQKPRCCVSVRPRHQPHRRLGMEPITLGCCPVRREFGQWAGAVASVGAGLPAWTAPPADGRQRCLARARSLVHRYVLWGESGLRVGLGGRPVP